MNEDQLTLFAADSPAKTSAWPESARAWMEAGLDSGLSSIAFLQRLNQSGRSSKMCPVFSVAMAGETLRSCLEGLPESYQAFLMAAGATQALLEGQSEAPPGVCLTLSISEWPNDAAVCSLSQVLETDVAPKFYLSATAALGILRRAEKRGKELPPLLQAALEATARGLECCEKAEAT